MGSAAADERFYQHVPEMRSHYGSNYPASFYCLQEAYDLERQIKITLRTGFRGVESAGITDENDHPLLPGEKAEEGFW